jgi:hypothetical protein
MWRKLKLIKMKEITQNETGKLKVNSLSKTLKSDDLLNTYPSFNEIINNPKYGFHLVINQQKKTKLCSTYQDWEVLAKVVNIMCNNLYDLGMYKSYSFTYIDKSDESDSILNREGYGYVYDAHENIHKVDFKTFIKLTLVMYLSFMGIKLTDEQYDSYISFRSSSYSIRRILD